MVLDTQNLIILIVCIVIGVAILLFCIYCCACKPACANARRRLISRQIARDEEAIDQEREANRVQLRETLTTNEQTRKDIRSKYQLK